MKSLNTVDLAETHRFFADDCFNRAREIMERPRRSFRDDELLITLCHAALWHRQQCDEGNDTTLSVGYWQISRAYALAGRPSEAMHYGELCLHFSQGLPPYFLAWAHETLARAAMVSGDAEAQVRHLDAAARFLAQIEDIEERARVDADMATIR